MTDIPVTLPVSARLKPAQTVCLIGPSGPAVTSLRSILSDLDCAVIHVASPSELSDTTALGGLAVGGLAATGADLTLIEYRPREVPLTQFTALLWSLQLAPLIVVGPELPELETAWLLAQGGACAYMAAGLSAAEKRALLIAHLPHVQAESLVVGRLRLDLSEGQAWYGGQPLGLTATQFKLLCTLMQRPGQAIDCSSLATLAQCRGVPAHLAGLRRKLAAHSAAFLLRGTPQQGYALDARRQPRSVNVGFALKAHLTQLF
ncbi:winged helix-turn-helix domain-containing protein [Deinococcus koreensis]|uniref:OmpR/PhoB-type domain-containing protein n=1 Tax=Deinococcus koreensis TaxID=2054903 RepID=A0A2K3USQ4_9DEIO|nr:winged helix-turn-helix domain-containing protein [Deinococcus koreensis]PNY79569.1 hypothetical protein CVO96_19285 [Deinococcus koreensis]